MASRSVPRARPPAMVYDPIDDEDVDQLPVAQRRHMLEGVGHVHERKGSAAAVLPPHGDVDDDNDGMPMDDEFEDDFSLWELFKPMGKALGRNIILGIVGAMGVITCTYLIHAARGGYTSRRPSP